MINKYNDLIDDLMKVRPGPEWGRAAAWLDSLSAEVPPRQREKNYRLAKEWFETIGRQWVLAS